MRTKPVGMNTESNKSVNGCNGTSFTDRGVLHFIYEVRAFDKQWNENVDSLVDWCPVWLTVLKLPVNLSH